MIKIPKIIHYCWFGPAKFSPAIKACIKSWKKYHPEYKFMFWNEENSPMEHPFVVAALGSKKYAFVSDYVRIWALNKYGGIYLDTDMLFFKSLNDLLINDFFIGYQSVGSVAGGVIGSIPKHEYLTNCLSIYDSIAFNPNDLTPIAIPVILTREYNQLEDKKSVLVLEPKYFYAYPFEARANGELNYWKYKEKDSYAVHLWNASWLPSFLNDLGLPVAGKYSYWIRLIYNYLRHILKL